MLELSPTPVPSLTLSAIMRALRPYQWVKNLLVVVPTIAAHRMSEPELFGLNLLAFCCFCLAASGVYLANDVFDVESDRLHPRKRLRPVASGELSIPTAKVLSIVCIVAAIVLAWTTVSREFASLMLLYVAAAGTYSTRLKREPVVDVFLLAGLYVVRVIAGGVATAIPISRTSFERFSLPASDCSIFRWAIERMSSRVSPAAGRSVAESSKKTI
jgi:decaprenyl-phosphate phosphoribosyltransferase